MTTISPGEPASILEVGLPTPLPLPQVESNRAVLYLRLSEDELARGASATPEVLAAELDRQRKPARRLAKKRGLEIVGEYVDLDRSAYQDRERPEFERLLRDAPAGAFDYVIPWASDRLYRRMRDLSRITDELARHVRIVPVEEGEIDLTTAAGIFQAQVLGALGEFESRRKGERVRERCAQRAVDERRSSTSKRPVGWTWAEPCPRGSQCEHRRRCTDEDRRPRHASRGGLVPDPLEAPILARSYELIAEGRSLNSVHRELWATMGIITRPQVLRRTLLAHRHAGIVSLNGKAVAEAADGQRIVSVELWQKVREILQDPARKPPRGRPRQTFLSGILRCGAEGCGAPMNAKRHYRGGREFLSYICGPDGHTERRRAPVDAYVLRTVRALLVRDAEELRLRAVPDAGPAHARAAAQVAELQNRLDAYAELGRTGAMEPVDVAATTRLIRADLERAREQAAVSGGKPATARLLRSADVGAAWDAMLGPVPDRERVRLVLGELVESIRVEPGRQGDEGVEIAWCSWANA